MKHFTLSKIKLHLILIALLTVSQGLFAQQSATNEELTKLRSFYGYPIESWDSLRCAWYDECTPTNHQLRTFTPITCNLAKRMFGWHVAGTSSSSYIWQSLSDLSYFGYDVDPSTGVDNSGVSSTWQTNSTIVAAHNNGVNVNLCIILQDFSISQTSFNTFFANANGQQQTLITNSINAVVAANAKGINVDFEGFGSSANASFISFIQALSTQLHSTVPGSELSIDFLAGNSSSSFLSSLDLYVDLFIMMGYDYYYNGVSNPGPVAPLYNFYSGPYGSVSNDLNNFLKTVSINKMILAMPYYGRRWGVSNGCTLPGIGSGTSAISTQTYAQYIQNSNGYYSNPQYDPYTFNAYNCFTDNNGIPNQQFIDDALSLQKKYDVIKQRNIAGGAVWRLGYDAGYSDCWNLINDNLSTCAVVNCSGTIYDMGGPDGNYHDNEDYSFTIAPPNASSVTLTFSSFNIESGYDYLKIYNGPNISSPLIANLSGNTLPSAVIASSGIMTIQFHSDGATNYSGYEAVYSCNTSQTYSINTSSSPSVGGNTTGAGTYNSGQAVTVVATSNSGYTFVNWTEGGTQVSTNSSYSFTALNNRTLVANFTSTPIYTISTSSSPSAGGTTSGSGTFPSGQQTTVVATSNSGYTFVNWTESGSQVTTNASYTFNVIGNRNLVANFTNCTFSLDHYSTSLASSSLTGDLFWINTTDGCPWSATTNGCSWITINNPTGVGMTLINVTVSANTLTQSRTCTITVGGQTFTVTQLGYVAPCSIAPTDPNGLSTGYTGSNQITLSWAGSSVNVTTFEVERSLSSSGPFSLIASTGTTFSYTDNTGIPGTTYYYRVRACCNSNCSNYTNIASAVSCIWHTPATGVIASMNNTCPGNTIILSEQGGSLGTGDVWTWYHNGIIGTGTTIAIAPTISGLYCVKPNGSTCPQTVINSTCINITVNPSATASTISASGATIFCSGGSVTLSGNSGGTWSNGATTSTITVNTSGDYFVTNTNSCGTVTSNHILVTVNALPTANAGLNVTIPTGTSTTLSGSASDGTSPYNYSWTPAASLVNALIQIPSTVNLSNTTTFTLTVTDNNSCQGTDQVIVNIIPTVTISGAILSEQNAAVRTVTLNVTGSGSPQTMITATDGLYSFTFPFGESDTIRPFKNNDVTVTNGITTLDILLIQRHILNTVLLSSPYKIIAADVNLSGSVTTLDILLIRQLILGTTTSFPHGMLWNFVPSDYIFANPTNPFPFNNYKYYASTSALTNQNFIGMKLGDVNNSWNPSIAKTGYVGSVNIDMPSGNALPGEQIKLPVTARQFRAMSGYQFTINWNLTVLSFVGVDNAAVVNGEYGLNKKDEGAISVLWTAENAESLDLADETPLFYLTFKAIGKTGDASPVTITSSITPIEAVNNNLDLVELKSEEGTVSIGNSDLTTLQKLSNLNIYPNPNGGSFMVELNLSSKENVSLKIMNTLGQVVFNEDYSQMNGEHKIPVSLGEKAAGVYVVKLQTEEGIMIKKVMVN